jgi:hypothetical protein
MYRGCSAWRGYRSLLMSSFLTSNRLQPTADSVESGSVYNEYNNQELLPIWDIPFGSRIRLRRNGAHQ